MLEWEPSKAESYVLGRVGTWKVLIGIASVLEVVARVAIRPLPGGPAGVVGLIDYRKNVAVAVDLRERFGLPAPTSAWDPMVVTAGAPRFALIFDAVETIVQGPERHAAPFELPSERIAGLAWIGERTSILIDPARMLDPGEHAALRAALDAMREADPHAEEA
jgi:chemotaxis signal transduction protein